MYNLENFYDFRKKSVNAVALLESCIGIPEDIVQKSPDTDGYYEDMDEQLQQGMQQDMVDPMSIDPQYPQTYNPQNSWAVEEDRKPPFLLFRGNQDEGMQAEGNPTQDPLLSRPEDIPHSSRYNSRNEEMCDEQTLYTCGVCGKGFSSKNHLALHSKIHLKEDAAPENSSPNASSSTVDKANDPNWQSGYYRPYRCDLCNKSYSTDKHRWGHVNICHRGNPLVTCHVCSKMFSTIRNLQEHKKVEHGLQEGINFALKPEPDADFQPLDMNVANTNSVPEESQERNEEVLHTCVQCLKIFGSEQELERHHATHKRRLSSDSCASSRSTSTERGRNPRKIASSKEPSLLKQTLLQNRDLIESKGRKRSPSVDSRDENKIKKRTVPIMKSNTGNRRKSSRPRKIARNEEYEWEERKQKNDNIVNEQFINKFKCQICSQIFKTLSQLQEHSIVHEAVNVNDTSSKPFICLICEKQFSLRATLSRHFNACHGIDLADVTETSQCMRPNTSPQSKFANQTSVAYPIPTVEDDEDDDDDEEVIIESQADSQSKLPCEVCSREFCDRASLWLHLRYTHKEYAAYACGICLQICENNAMLYQHWKTCHPPESNAKEQRRYTCQMCGRQHDSRKKLVAHVSVHNLDDGIGGTYDPEMIITVNTNFHKYDNQEGNSAINDYNSALDTEISSEFGNDYLNPVNGRDIFPFGCEFCYKSFPTEDGLVKHKKSAHKLNSIAELGAPSSSRGSYQLYFVCELCGSSHPSKSERWRHVFRAHNGESTLTCEQPGCGKVFPTRTLKQEHSTNHHRLQGETPNVCEICGKLWGTRVDFWKHLMGVHQDCVPLTCGVCLKIFCNVPDLQSHVHMNHWPLVGGEFCCDICGRPYSNRSKLSRHRRIHLVADNFSKLQSAGKAQSSFSSFSDDSFNMYFDTPRSSDTFPKKSKANSVAKKAKSGPAVPTSLMELFGNYNPPSPKPPPKPFCDICPEMTFESIAILADHRRRIHGLQPCDLCSKFYGRTSHLWKHVKRVHNNHPELTCPTCKRISASKAHLENHIQTKHGPKNANAKPKEPVSTYTTADGKIVKIPTLYPCQKCSKRFWKRYLLKKHMQNCLRPSRPKSHKLTQNIKCDMCSKVFQTNSKLRDHKKTAHIPQPCEVCPDVTYTSKLDLFNHIKEVHEGHENFTCPFPGCMKVMRNKSDCDSHHTQHKSVKFPPTCYLCGEVCSSKIKLWSHLKSAIHKSAIPRICGMCFKYFQSTEELRQHVRENHPKALKAADTCRICAKTYSSIYKVLDHFSKCHHGYYACRECLNAFSSKEELQAHTEKGHEKEVVTKKKDSEEPENNEVKSEGEEDDEDMNQDEENGEEKQGAERDQLPCEFCDLSFQTSAALMEHTELKHQNDALYVNSKEGEDSESSRPVKRPRRSYNCEKCSLEFRSPSDLSDHKKTKHSAIPSVPKPYCNDCDKHFAYKSSYLKHINSPAHQIKQSNVSLSRKDDDTNTNTTFNSDKPYEYTQESDQQDSPLTSEKIVGSGSSGQAEVAEDVSVQESTGKKPVVADKLTYYCELCGKQWATRKQLWQHLIRNHRREAAVTCGVCMGICEDYDNLTLHLSSQHPELFSGEINNFTCRVCGRYHAARSKLIQHATIHIVLGPEPELQPQSTHHDCEICFKPFISEQSLLQHMKVRHPSSKTGQHKCDVCLKAFHSLDALRAHSKVHQLDADGFSNTEETETEEVDEDTNSNSDIEKQHFYTCEVCLKTFKTEFQYCQHKETHDTSRNKIPSLPQSSKLLIPRIEKQHFYVCDVCASVFVTEKALASHSETHRSTSLSSQSELSQDSVISNTNKPQEVTPNVAKPVESSHKYYTCSRCKKNTFTSYLNLIKHHHFCRLNKLPAHGVDFVKKWREEMRARTSVSVKIPEISFSSDQTAHNVESADLKEQEAVNMEQSTHVETSEKLTENFVVDKVCINEAETASINEAEPASINEAQAACINETDTVSTDEMNTICTNEAETVCVNETQTACINGADTVCTDETDTVCTNEAQVYDRENNPHVPSEQKTSFDVQTNSPCDYNDILNIASENDTCVTESREFNENSQDNKDDHVPYTVLEQLEQYIASTSADDTNTVNCSPVHGQERNVCNTGTNDLCLESADPVHFALTDNLEY